MGAAVIVFRETLEAALIIGIIAAATRGLVGRGRWLFVGVMTGLVGSVGMAALADRIAQWAEGTGPDLFNALVLGIAVIMLAWHNIWMSHHGAQMAREARLVGQAVLSGGRAPHAIFLVIALAVLREGSETVLFLYSLLTGEGGVAAVLLGGALGLAAGALAGWILYAGFVRVPVKWFFSVTGVFVLLLAAAMASQMARFLAQADLVPSLANPLWDSSALLTNESPLGTLLHLLAGYEARPSGMQVVFYCTAFLFILLGMVWGHRPASQTAQ